jgi:hypothetical protein
VNIEADRAVVAHLQ